MCNKVENSSQISEQIAEPLNNIVEAVQRSLSEKVAASVLGALPDMEALNKKHSYEIDSIGKQLTGLTANIQGLEKTGQVLSEQFYEDKVVQPMVRGLFPIIDLIEDAREKLINNQSLSLLTSEYLIACRTQLEEFLGYYNITSFRHEAGEQFAPKYMKPVKTALTTQPEQEGRIAGSLQCGFNKQDRILRLESVSLYKYQNEKNIKELSQC